MLSDDTASSVPMNIVHGSYGQLVLFLVLNVWPSHFGLPLLLLVIFSSKNIQRHPTFINLCIAFIIVGIMSSSLLLYAGKLIGPEPSKMLCLFQASLLYGMPPLTSTAAFTLVFQMFLVIQAAYRGKEYRDQDHAGRLWAMILFPYLFFFVSVIVTAVVGASMPENISRNRRFFYCSVESLALTNALTIFAAIALFMTLITEACTVYILCKRWVALKRNDTTLGWTIELSLPLRILGFGLYIIVAMSLSLLSIKSPSSPVPDLVIAAAASVVMIIFGTQTDILRALRFWSKPSSDYDHAQKHGITYDEADMKPPPVPPKP
ncbi:hypothetical protein BDQ17DRAFT_1348993 [Cyathus striatus]|nr:hypothetical protein BDQ17DRAFT_1348993 [Cyathus striatus]